MEPISITLEVANPANPVEWVEVEFLLDLGNRIAIVPAAILEKLGIYPFEKRSYDFEACEHRGVGIALFRRKGDSSSVQDPPRYRFAAAQIIFGQAGDANLLGIDTLHEFHLRLHPLRRDLHGFPRV